LDIWREKKMDDNSSFFGFLTLLFIASLFWGTIADNIARQKGRSGFVAGFFFGLLAVIYYWSLPKD